MRELDTQRMAEYDRSERRIGISKEVWFLASLPSGDQLVGYMEAQDFGRAVGEFGASQDAFDRCVKERILGLDGVRFNNIPPDFARRTPVAVSGRRDFLTEPMMTKARAGGDVPIGGLLCA